MADDQISDRGRWIPIALAAAIAYLVIGLAFGSLAKGSASGQGAVAWRRAAWIVSAAVFAAQLVYEEFRLRNPPIRAAWHAALASALGAFGLAAAANVHARMAPSGPHRPMLLPSLAFWPVLTAVPAFVVALAAATVLHRWRRRR